MLDYPLPQKVRRQDLEAKVLTIHQESFGTYGSPRITAELYSQGESVSHWKAPGTRSTWFVRRLALMNAIVWSQVRRYPKTRAVAGPTPECIAGAKDLSLTDNS